MDKVLVINGVNLGMLGRREPEKYGNLTLKQIEEKMLVSAKSLQLELEFFQSDCEGDIVSKLNSSYGNVKAVIINAGAYTHYSYAIADSLNMLNCVKVEVHITNVYAREEFRHKSVIAPSCNASVCGMGAYGYIAALNFIAEQK